MKRTILIILVLCTCLAAQARPPQRDAVRPALIVGIVVDQMRYDYLTRYWERFGDGGFRRLVGKGFSCEEAHYNYVPTYTAVGHSAIYTGTVPAHNGIVGNNWYDRALGRATYVTDDSTVTPVGTTGDAGRMSPQRLLSTTITDELRLVSNFESKVIGISLKDRSSILPAGHRPNAAYWYDGGKGNWITSSYYMAVLPEWVRSFNARRMPDSLLSGQWSPLLPLDEYTESLPDTQAYANRFVDSIPSLFPYDLSMLKKALGYDLLRRVPFGNTYTLEFAKEAVSREKLGAGGATDFLTLSLSSTDYVGHQFTARAVETEDTYLRLDRDLAGFLAYLDAHVGAGRWLVFLTSDHGASENAAYMRSLGMPGGVFSSERLVGRLNARLSAVFGAGRWILDLQNLNLYFNRPLMNERAMAAQEVEDTCAAMLRGVPGVADVLTADKIMLSADPFIRRIANGYNPERSGDLVLLLKPGWYEGEEDGSIGGTTHGSGYAHNTHVPLVWYGWKIGHGATFDAVTICDIAPTLAAILRCSEPNASIGEPIRELMKFIPPR